jgi:serine/threonine-protein kinase
MDLWVKRFRREANVIAGLQSPHTIYLYDFASRATGSSITSWNCSTCVSLQTLITQFGPQPPSRVRSMLMQVCESLEEAHQQSLVHRDLKPSNVMLCKVALQHDFVKVLDFGLAKCAACEDATQLTVEGVTARHALVHSRRSRARRNENRRPRRPLTRSAAFAYFLSPAPWSSTTRIR